MESPDIFESADDLFVSQPPSPTFSAGSNSSSENESNKKPLSEMWARHAREALDHVENKKTSVKSALESVPTSSDPTLASQTTPCKQDAGNKEPLQRPASSSRS